MRLNCVLGSVCVVLLMAGCGSDDHASAPAPTPTPTPVPEPEPETPVEPEYEAPDPGYLLNAEFLQGEQGNVDQWSLLAHASNGSYSVIVDDGVMMFTRVGVEPWGKVRQLFKGESIEPFIGRTLRFSADMRAEFTSEWGEAMEAPGLVVTAKGIPAGSPPILGSSLLLSEKAAVDDLDVSADWHRYEVEFELPTAEQALVVELEVGFLMTEGGSLYVRGPALIAVEEIVAD
ncbi:hypothetical protein [Gilvimarinus algae]|uniref:DUF1080 domain-containing protein n=1 Tax=Gilvimarinus algae TaxID=3058037 RepID=A0ABT8TBC8_9GAMM|nr:hypothetical protein [Gilvimarinus sp. SDUM040014]MDO3380935.1 hypothetical protein [Gilvimarinus sp. SDUM040014]